ncbi:uncharacterized protein NECHADRAFT_89066 [Fusarium vanettenii 77-13-4]|uniref:Uncharacterized protein n=1 Tax=Fusarium vanettenii (strain ATCC MYA-4622 / CBS 123669 / FGSC 9596 / NRRL 45880 / 77-13-4) TaxID=660122 RepID=C7ZQ29_FUSV7|nr:uncharacterized protein NECHADRAFT_89066 [Fusarium vanettenii 77-13-4]EEU33874.1 predicted protein [Fusarium vanettenii 77-13-4]
MSSYESIEDMLNLIVNQATTASRTRQSSTGCYTARVMPDMEVWVLPRGGCPVLFIAPTTSYGYSNRYLCYSTHQETHLRARDDRENGLLIIATMDVVWRDTNKAPHVCQHCIFMIDCPTQDGWATYIKKTLGLGIRDLREIGEVYLSKAIGGVY